MRQPRRGRRGIVEDAIDRLSNNNAKFGRLPCSYYPRLGADLQDRREAFIITAENLPVIRALGLPPGTIDDVQLPTLELLKDILKNLDQYGGFVELWKVGDPVPEVCRDWLRTMVKRWTERKLRSDELVLPWRLIPHHLLRTLQDNVDKYQYDCDFFLWALPILEEALQRERLKLADLPGGAPSVAQGFRNQLTLAAEQILTSVENTYGITGIDRDQVVSLTVDLVTCAGPNRYLAGRAQLSAALATLRDVIKVEVIDRVEPEVDHPWGRDPRADAIERRRCRRLLQAYGSL